MRLIDADELIKGRVENDPVRIAAGCAPTAFDKEKVIEELKEKQSESLNMREDKNTSCTPELKSFWNSRLEAYTLAIEIVEKGGIENEKFESENP